MHKPTCAWFHALLACVALSSGCAGKTVQPEEYSGYLGEGYSQLKEEKDPRGELVLRYVNTKLNPNNYNALMIDPIVFHPIPKPTEQVSEQTLREMGQYFNRTFRQKLGEKVLVVDQPGPGVVRLSVAFTAVRGQDESLEAYQYVPLAFIATMGNRAVAGTPQQARLLIEAVAVDSVSGERLMMQVRQGTGEELKKIATGTRVLTLDAIKPFIDNWAEASAQGVNKLVKAK